MPSRHRFLEPIHNVKEGEIPHIRRRADEIRIFISGKYLRPSFAGAHQPACQPKPQAKAGGAYRDRTDDLKLAKLALSQLS